jgi:transposase-like protein
MSIPSNLSSVRIAAKRASGISRPNHEEPSSTLRAALAVNTRLVASARVAEAAGEDKKVRTRKSYSDTVKLEAFKLRDQGLTFTEIAKRLDVLSGTPTVTNWLGDPTLRSRYERSKAPVTVEQFESEEAKLERQLAEVRAKKQAVIAAKAFKFSPITVGVAPGVMIRKEGNTLALSLTDAEELIIKLDDYLKELKN